jgi:hypothetical protein
VEFLPWIETEFQWSDKTAQNYMRAAEMFGDKFETVSNLPITITALYELAAPDVPEAVREEAVKAAKTGTKITKTAAKRIKDGYGYANPSGSKPEPEAKPEPPSGKDPKPGKDTSKPPPTEVTAPEPMKTAAQGTATSKRKRKKTTASELNFQREPVAPQPFRREIARP